MREKRKERHNCISNMRDGEKGQVINQKKEKKKQQHIKKHRKDVKET